MKNTEINSEPLTFNINELLSQHQVSKTSSAIPYSISKKPSEITDLEKFYKENTNLKVSDIAPTDVIENFLFHFKNGNSNISLEDLSLIHKEKNKKFNAKSIIFVALCIMTAFASTIFSKLLSYNVPIDLSLFCTLLTCSIYCFLLYIYIYNRRFSFLQEQVLKFQKLILEHNIEHTTQGMFFYNKFKSDNIEFNNYLVKEFTDTYKFREKLSETYNVQELYSSEHLNQTLSTLIHEYKESLINNSKPVRRIISMPRPQPWIA